MSYRLISLSLTQAVHPSLVFVGFTGIDSPYESPKSPEVVVKTADMSVKECMMEVIDHLKEKGIVPSSATEQVNELFVHPANLPAAKAEAASLPQLNITKVSPGKSKIGLARLHAQKSKLDDVIF